MSKIQNPGAQESKEIVAKAVAARAVWNFQPAPAAGQKTRLELHVVDEKGQPLDKFELIHTKPMHLIGIGLTPLDLVAHERVDQYDQIVERARVALLAALDERAAAWLERTEELFGEVRIVGHVVRIVPVWLFRFRCALWPKGRRPCKGSHLR